MVSLVEPSDDEGGLKVETQLLSLWTIRSYIGLLLVNDFLMVRFDALAPRHAVMRNFIERHVLQKVEHDEDRDRAHLSISVGLLEV